VQKQFYTGFVAVDVQVIDAAGVEGRGTTNDAVHGVTFSEQQFRQVGTVLSGYACLKHTGSGRIKKQKERGQTMDFFVGGMKRIQFKKKNSCRGWKTRTCDQGHFARCALGGGFR